jgi:short-subunit dehydrogenase
MEIQSSVAVVTGASSGIGRATALALAKRGAHVVVAARREEKLRELESFIEKNGGEATSVACDVTRPEDIRRLAAVVKEAFGRCDILVNNAGIPAGGSFDELTYERMDEIVATNLTSVLHATKAFLPMMRHHRRGHVINIASLAGRHPVPGAAVYSATKHAVVAFSESMNHETARDGVRVTAICPAFVNTEGFPQKDLPDAIVMPMKLVTRAIVKVIERGRAPQVTIPRWAGALEFFRVAVPGPYRWVVGRVLMPRGRDR